MYVGIVRGSGKNDMAGAKEAFARAQALDPDSQARHPARNAGDAEGVSEMPAAARSRGCARRRPESPSSGSRGNSRAVQVEPVALDCTPEVKEIETRRPIPVECSSEKQVALARAPLQARRRGLAVA